MIQFNTMAARQHETGERTADNKQRPPKMKADGPMVRWLEVHQSGERRREGAVALAAATGAHQALAPSLSLFWRKDHWLRQQAGRGHSTHSLSQAPG